MGELARMIRRTPSALAAAGALTLYLLAALLGPLIVSTDPLALGDAPLQRPGMAHPFGTDSLGRDVFSRVVHGARESLGISALAVVLALAAGGGAGLLAGYFGRVVDAALSRATDVMFALPEILLALVIMAILPPGPWSVALAIALVYTPVFARVTRTAVLPLRSAGYVEAARTLGAGHLRVLARHVLPNAAGPLIVQTTLSLAFAVLAQASLSFLGLGGEPDAPSWGMMLRRGKDWMAEAWWIALFPGLAISGAVLAFNVLGDAMRDALDVRSGRRG